MTATTHAVAPEDIMAWLDGELSVSEAEVVTLHLDDCTECAALADDLRNTSQSLARWTVPAIPAGLEESITKAIDGREKSYRPIRTPHRNWKVWAIGGCGAVVAVTLAIIFATPRSEQTSTLSQSSLTGPQSACEPPHARKDQPLYEQMGKSKQADRYQGTINATLAVPNAVNPHGFRR